MGACQICMPGFECEYHFTHRLVRELDDARSEAERYRKTLEVIADGSVWNAVEAAQFVLGRIP
jgi:hypothetical protein